MVKDRMAAVPDITAHVAQVTTSTSSGVTCSLALIISLNSSAVSTTASPFFIFAFIPSIVLILPIPYVIVMQTLSSLIQV